MSPSKKVLVTIAGLVLAGLLAYAGLLKFAEYRAMSKLTPEQQELYRQWQNSTVTATVEDVRGKPYGGETLAALEEYRAQWQAHRGALDALTEAAYEGDARPFGEVTPTIGTEDIAEAQPLLDAFETLVNQPDYDLGIFMPQEVPALMSGASPQWMLRLRNAARGEMAAAALDARNGNSEKAAERLRSISNAVRLPEYFTAIDLAIAGSLTGECTRGWDALLENAGRELETEVRDDAAKLYARLPEVSLVDLMVNERLAILKPMLTQDSTVKLDGVRAPELAVLMNEITADYLENQAPNVTGEAAARYEAKAEELRRTKLTAGKTSDLVLFSIAAPGLQRLLEEYEKTREELRALLPEDGD